jgi:hypothetical protein
LEVYINLQKWDKQTLLAICDLELVGKTLREGKIVFEVREEFYKGTKVTIDEAIGLMENCSIVNMVGQHIVGKAVEKGFVHPDAVMEISGVPHAQIVKL